MDEYCRNFPETATLDCVSNLKTSQHLQKGDSQLKNFQIHKIINIQTYNFAIFFTQSHLRFQKLQILTYLKIQKTLFTVSLCRPYIAWIKVYIRLYCKKYICNKKIWIYKYVKMFEVLSFFRRHNENCIR